MINYHNDDMIIEVGDLVEAAYEIDKIYLPHGEIQYIRNHLFHETAFHGEAEVINFDKKTITVNWPYVTRQGVKRTKRKRMPIEHVQLVRRSA